MPRILIVEDEPDHSDFMAAYLKREGYDTRCVDNGREALKLLLHNGIDGMVLDVRMPGMTGVELLEIVRSYLRWSTLPVVVVTANASAEELARIDQLGVARVFQKAGFKLVDLLQVLRQVVTPAKKAGDA
jgi:CheY-like chemotaxis protein